MVLNCEQGDEELVFSEVIQDTQASLNEGAPLYARPDYQSAQSLGSSWVSDNLAFERQPVHSG